MFNAEKRIASLAELGRVLRAFAAQPKVQAEGATDSLTGLLESSAGLARQENPWFVEPFIRHALNAIGDSLQREKMEEWLSAYGLTGEFTGIPKKIGVVMAGNIPLVGFHDMLSVLVSGNRFLGKLSARDARLPVALAQVLTTIEPRWQPFIEFTGGPLRNPDAIIATGSNNTSRYFRYYFGRYPHIIRRNRNSLALLQGNETEEELAALAGDVFLYFGLGCRNVSKLLVPEGYDFKLLINAFREYEWLIDHHKYANNYTYRRAIYQMNREPHLDTGFLILKEEPGLSSPIAVLHYQYYRTMDEAKAMAGSSTDEIQCLVGNLPGWIPFGSSQNPGLTDYADGIDTIHFLNSL